MKHRKILLAFLLPVVFFMSLGAGIKVERRLGSTSALSFTNLFVSNAIYTNDGTLAICGIGGTNNENEKWDYESVANTKTITSSTGLATYDFGAIRTQFNNNITQYAKNSSAAVVSAWKVLDDSNYTRFYFPIKLATDTVISNSVAGQLNIGTSELNGTTFSPQMGRDLAARLMGLMTACKLLYIPLTETGVAAGTAVDLSSLGHTLTYTGTATTRMGYQGFMKAYAFNGTSDYLTTPDAADLSFGNGIADVAWFAWAVINVTDTAAVKTIIFKANNTSNLDEYKMTLSATETIIVTQYDESASKTCTLTSNAGLAAGIHFVVYTNSGLGGATAMNTGLLYDNGRVIASTAGNDAGYVGMEDLTSPFLMGVQVDNTTYSLYFPSGIYAGGVGTGAPTAATIWNAWLEIASKYNLPVT
jgi:hypothetical protein